MNLLTICTGNTGYTDVIENRLDFKEPYLNQSVSEIVASLENYEMVNDIFVLFCCKYLYEEGRIR